MNESLNFNLKLYRERLADKYSRSPVETRFDSSFIESNRKTPNKTKYKIMLEFQVHQH